jgi:hypothetical protein
MALRFHLDESVDPSIAVGLRQRGIDVTTAGDVQLLGASDRAHLGFALAQRRVLVTHDRDFLRIAASGADHAGIAYCPPAYRTIGQIVIRLADLCRHRSEEQMQGVVEFL